MEKTQVLAVRFIPSSNGRTISIAGPEEGYLVRVGSTPACRSFLIDDMRRYHRSFHSTSNQYEFELGSHRLPSCFRVLQTNPQADRSWTAGLQDYRPSTRAASCRTSEDSVVRDRTAKAFPDLGYWRAIRRPRRAADTSIPRGKLICAALKMIAFCGST